LVFDITAIERWIQ